MQARLGSTRLPGKAFFTFFGLNMIERSIAIARSIKGVDRVVLATGDREENLALKPFVEKAGAEFFIGSEDNVLERFCKALASYDGEYCLRMTCDNYLVQPEIIEVLYGETVEKNADYAYIAPLSHFSGEIVRCERLRHCQQNRHSDYAKEHVTWDIRESGEKVLALPSTFRGIDHSCKLTLDTLDDLLTMKGLERNFPDLGKTRCLSALRDKVLPSLPDKISN